MRELAYDREAAVAYARRWALDRNPAYFNFETIGGDCTNFASQCIYAGSGVMNVTQIFGWYYRSASDRTASWTGVEYLYRFLVNNRGAGPYGHIAELREIQPGDLVQLANADGRFYHSPVITAVFPTVQVAAHSFDALDRELSSYTYDRVRFLHIDGVRTS